MDAQVDPVTFLDAELLGQAFVEDDRVFGDFSKLRLLQSQFPKRLVDAHDDDVVGARFTGRPLGHTGKLEQGCRAGAEFGTELAGQFGAEKPVVGGEGEFDPAQAGFGHVAQTAANRLADQQRPHQNHRPDGDAQQSADMAPRVKPERLQNQ